MRKLIVWILIIILTFGFIYVGNNLFAQNKTDLFPENYLPKENLIFKFDGSSELLNSSLKYYFSSLPSFELSEGFMLSDNLDSSTIIFHINSSISPLDYLIKQFRKFGFDIKLQWKNGFPVVYAFNTDKQFYSSVWRSFIFVSTDSNSLNKLLFGIIQKRGLNLLRNDLNFSKLWDHYKCSNCGIVYDKDVDFLKGYLHVPFSHCEYPAFFNFSGNTLTTYNLVSENATQNNIFIFDIPNELFEISESKADDIKNKLLNSGLSVIISDKIGIPFKAVSAFSSLSPGEFVLFDRNNFLFAVKSSIADNGIYRDELVNFLPDSTNATILEQSIGSLLMEYNNGTSIFYTLETPNMFIISTNKGVLDDIFKDSVKIKNFKGELFIKVSRDFNKIISLFDLNIDKVILPKNTSYCVVKETIESGKLKTVFEIH